MAYKPFKMKGHTLPGINQRSEGNTDLPDGRSKSSTFQFFATAGLAAAQNMRQQRNPQPPGGVGGITGLGGAGAGLGLTPPIVSKPSVAKIYNKEKGKRTRNGNSYTRI